jgi:hypothetical protein
MPDWALGYCERCGAPIGQRATGRPRRFCSDACRQSHYRVTKVNRTPHVLAGHTNVQARRAALNLGNPGKPSKAVRP